MNKQFNTHESEDTELVSEFDIEKKSVDEWFRNLDKDAPENEPYEHMNKYNNLKNK